MSLLLLLIKRVLPDIQSGPVPIKTFDFSAGALPDGVTFLRVGARMAVNSLGLLSVVASGNAAFDYDSTLTCRGVSIESAATHKWTYNNTFNAVGWTKSTSAAIAQAPAITDPTGGHAAWKLSENSVASSQYYLQRNQSLVSGSRNTVSVYAMQGERSQLAITMIDVRVVFDLSNGTCYWGANSANEIDVDAWMEPVGNTGWYRCVVSSTLSGITGMWYPTVYVVNSLDAISYAGTVGSGIYIFGGDFTDTANAVAWAETTASTISTNADTLIASDLSWLNTAKGTFVVEHDVRLTGAILGSGANAIVSGNQPSMLDGGKIAFAWDGTDSMTVINGRTGTVGAVPTFSADLIFGGTSVIKTNRRIKRVRYYAEKLTEAQLRSLTARPIASGSPGSWRVVTHRNRVNAAAASMSGSILHHFSRFQQTISGGDVSEIKLNFHNFYFDATPAEAVPGNALVIDAVALESVTLGTSVPVYFGASRSVTLANGATDITSDSILPSAFGLTKFTDQEKYYVRLKCHVTTAGHKITGRRNATEEGISGQQSYKYDPALTAVSAVDGAGDFTWTGTAPTTQTYAHTPFVIGKFVTGDPLTWLGIGDSIMAGSTGVGSVLGPFQLALQAADGTAERPGIEISVGGSHDQTYTGAALWKSYIKYCRVAYHETGINARAVFYYRKNMAKLLRSNGIEWITGHRLSPYTTSTDEWASEANQTVMSNMINASAWSVSAYKTGLWDNYAQTLSMRGVDREKWPTNGASKFATADGLHPSVAGHALLADDMRAVIEQCNVYRSTTR